MTTLSTLSLMFSMALITGYSFTVMISLIFAGEANTLTKYITFVLGAALALTGFGLAMEEIVHLIIALEN